MEKTSKKTAQPFVKASDIARLRSPYALQLIWDAQHHDSVSRKALANNPSTPEPILNELQKEPGLAKITAGALQLKAHLPPPNPYLKRLEEAGVIGLEWHLGKRSS